jgi:nitrogen-specific signal transduction histidine kinase
VTIICDANGTLLAASNEADGWLTSSRQGAESNQRVGHYTGIFGPESALSHWISAQMEQGVEEKGTGASSDISHNGEILRVKMECLKNAGELFGYALHLSPQPQDQSTKWERERWHDIKNHVGSLKLYATFLQKKLPDGEDKQVVERLLKAIDTLAEQLARIRRGDRT